MEQGIPERNNGSGCRRPPHATILEMNVESYRRREALDNRGKRKRGRPASYATEKNTTD